MLPFSFFSRVSCYFPGKFPYLTENSFLRVADDKLPGHSRDWAVPGTHQQEVRGEEQKPKRGTHRTPGLEGGMAGALAMQERHAG